MIAEMMMGAVLAMPPKAKPEPPAKCRDRHALMLWHAGFRGDRNIIAWAVTWRESKHRNLDHTSPWFSGAYGWFQVQESAHQHKPWYSREAMLDKQRQARIVYLHMTKRGTYWAPWGLTPNGLGIDASHYPWSAWQIQNWIWNPYAYARSIYPKACAR